MFVLSFLLGCAHLTPTGKQARELAPEVAVVGLAPSGGVLPEDVRRDAMAALEAGLSLASGLHTLLISENVVEQSGFSGTEEARENRHRDPSRS